MLEVGGAGAVEVAYAGANGAGVYFAVDYGDASAVEAFEVGDAWVVALSGVEAEAEERAFEGAVAEYFVGGSMAVASGQGCIVVEGDAKRKSQYSIYFFK